MILSYKYRLLPSKRQHRALEAILESQRQLYNAALEERIDCYQKTGKSLTYMTGDHNASLNILAAGIGRGAVNVVHQDVHQLRNMAEAPARESSL